MEYNLLLDCSDQGDLENVPPPNIISIHLYFTLLESASL